MEILPRFYEYLHQQGRSPLTIKGYRTDLKLFSQWFEQTNGETFLPPAVTPTDIREYRQYMLMVKRYKASTINRRLVAISVFMAWAKHTGQVEHSPSETVRSVAQVDSGPRYLDKKEQYALQRVIEKDLQISQLRYPKRWRTRRRDASMVLFLLNTGLRLSEMVALKLADIEILERKGSVQVLGKGNKQRIVPLNKVARQAVQDWLAMRSTENGNDDLWLAVEHHSGDRLSGRSVQRVLGRLGEAAKIDKLTPHMLRHTFAKNLEDQGIGLEKVAALLGHASLNTTRIYVKPNQKDLEAAVEGLAVE